MSWLRWAPLIAASLHIFEEFVWPGGFSEWYRRYQPSVALSFTPRFAVVINGILLLACLGAALQGPTLQGVVLWLTVVAILLGNVGFHVAAVLRTRAYSPGVVTAVLLYLPLGVYGFRYFVHAQLASTGTAAGALLVGLAYPIWSRWNHGRRSARARSVPCLLAPLVAVTLGCHAGKSGTDAVTQPSASPALTFQRYANPVDGLSMVRT